jgi:hypothetical protein
MAIRVKARNGESVEQMLRRFKKLCEKEGLTKEIKRRGPRKAFGDSGTPLVGDSTKQALAVRSFSTCWVTTDLPPGAVVAVIRCPLASGRGPAHIPGGGTPWR